MFFLSPKQGGFYSVPVQKIVFYLGVLS